MQLCILESVLTLYHGIIEGPAPAAVNFVELKLHLACRNRNFALYF